MMVTKRGTPKYQMIRDAVLSWIAAEQIAPGTKLPIESVLADQFKVSRQTVRQAIGELEQAGVLERRQGSGTYYLGMSTRTEPDTVQPSQIIGVVATYLSDYIFPHIIRGIEEHLSLEGYSPLLFSTQNELAKERKALETLLERGVDGVIVEPTMSAVANTNRDLYEQLASRGIPVVMIHATYDGWSAPLIEVDDRHGAFLATRYLIVAGHKRIGALIKLDDKQGTRRLEGFLSAGGVYHANLIAFYTTEGQERIVDQYTERLLHLGDDDRPTAIFCYNDRIASNLIIRLRQRGIRVPEDMSIVGFDDAALATLGYPPLTTVTHPKFVMGVQAATTLLTLIKDPAADRSSSVHTFTPELIVRESVRSWRAPMTAFPK